MGKHAKEIEPRHNVQLSILGLILSVLIAPIGAILCIVSLVRIAKNRLDETVAKDDRRSQIISVVGLIIGIAITLSITIMSANNCAPWQLYERAQAPQKIEQILNDDMDSIVNMSENNKQTIIATLEESYTKNDIDIEELGITGQDLFDWILGDITYTASEPTFNDDYTTASVNMQIHHRDLATFNQLYVAALTTRLEDKSIPSVSELGSIMRNIMDKTEFADEEIVVNFEKAGFDWQITEDSYQQLAHILFTTQANATEIVDETEVVESVE